MSKHFKVFVQGLVIVSPLLLTIYVTVKFATWLYTSVGTGLAKMLRVEDTEALPLLMPILGILALIGVIYMIGVMARLWLFQKLLGYGEALLDRIPLVKSLYSSVRDLLQFLSGTDTESKGVPARIRLMGDKVHLLGLITQKHPETVMGEGERGRVAVYLPMSYQIGGFTLFIDPEDVEELEGMSVEDVLKLSMTAGVGSTGHSQAGEAPSAP